MVGMSTSPDVVGFLGTNCRQKSVATQSFMMQGLYRSHKLAEKFFPPGIESALNPVVRIQSNSPHFTPREKGAEFKRINKKNCVLLKMYEMIKTCFKILFIFVNVYNSFHTQ